MTTAKDRFIVAGLFFEALKPHAGSILDTCIHITDAAVSASTRAEVRSAELEQVQESDTL